ncbi:MAG: hypothetical protein PSV23_17225 [Brevundimonas sp.]|uniref:hypothetical protein n=1 Tax=Brevundimonas sp. TaxID=1871086 RepID=UPI0024873A94|nr:hypothetical protein [Brevundimonas sp.]MDI1328535.1 hypothetical protein [Brevundimonas sp.]
MLALVLAAALAASPAPPPDMTRSILTDVCLPYVTGEARDATALEVLGLVSAPAADEDTLNFQSEDQAYLLRLTTTGSADDGNLNRVCVIQARRGGLDGVRTSVQPVLREQGFAPEADQPANRPIWTRGGVTVSVRQNEGRATVVRVTWSSLDAG